MGRQMRTVLVATVAVVVSLLVPATAQATTANLGPVITAVPATVSGGGAGTAALDAAVAAGCNAGAALADARWFTLAPGAAGQVVAQARVFKDGWNWRYAPEQFAAKVAAVDLTTGTLLRCGSSPVARSTTHRLGFVVWVSRSEFADYLANCRSSFTPCVDPEATLVVAPSSQTTPVNDDPAHATAVASVPATLQGDSTGGTAAEQVVGDGWPPDACRVANGAPVVQATVWWRWTATYSGSLVARLDSELPWSQLLVAEQTSAGLVPIDYERAPDVDRCVTGNPDVVAGHTYLIGVATSYQMIMSFPPFPAGGRFQLYLGKPGAPDSVGLNATSPSASSIALAWNGTGSPAGGAATTSFRVTRSDPSGTQVVTTLPSTARSYTFTGLAASTRYTVSVQGVSAVGAGDPDFLDVTTGSGATFATPAVTGIDASVVAATGSATLSWSAPGTTAVITGYAVSRDGTDKNGAGPWSTTVSASTRSFAFTALAGGSAYQLSVQPVTASGSGPATSVSVLVLPAAVRPGEPQAVSTSTDATARSVAVGWAPPWYDGQAPLTGYQVTLTPVGGGTGSTVLLAAGARSYTFTGIQSTVAYGVSVAAVNAAGTSPAAVVAVGPIVWTAPSAPYALTATPGDSSAVLRWHAPDDPGSFPISGYDVVVYDATSTTYVTSAHVTGPATSVAVSGLVNGASYSFDVRASNFSSVYNEGGSSALSARSVVFVPAKPPQPVITVPQGPRIKSVAGSVVKGRTVATVRWAAPANGGKPILGYRVYAYKVDASGHVLSSSRSTTISASRRSWSMTFSGVSRYRFAMRAVNAIGWSAYGGLSTTMAPASAPSAPRMGRATSGVPGGAVTASVTWSAPRSNGGTVVTGYRVFIYQLSAGGDVLSVTTSSLLKASARSWTGRLPAAGPYAFAVRAVNAMGQSRASARSSTVTGR